jgi:hypothetical protein
VKEEGRFPTLKESDDAPERIDGGFRLDGNEKGGRLFEGSSCLILLAATPGGLYTRRGLVALKGDPETSDIS